jgi:hypothetical protein
VPLGILFALLAFFSILLLCPKPFNIPAVALARASKGQTGIIVLSTGRSLHSANTGLLKSWKPQCMAGCVADCWVESILCHVQHG